MWVEREGGTNPKGGPGPELERTFTPVYRGAGQLTTSEGFFFPCSGKCDTRSISQTDEQKRWRKRVRIEVGLMMMMMMRSYQIEL